mgnify:CR=1 FL=1
MLTVKTKLKNSSIEGIGLFANEDIPKGKIVWEFSEGFDLELTKEQFQSLNEPQQLQILKYSYLSGDRYVMCLDDARFFNHADQPNVDCPEGNNCTANRDIKEGEELTCNYKEFDLDFKNKII